MLTEFFNIIFGIFDSIGVGIMGLAKSPFARMQDLASDNATVYMLNWIFPFGPVTALLETWGVSIGSWYVYKYIKKHYKGVIDSFVDGFNSGNGRK